ncbi:endonuclease VII domain-containing protein [Streptomyces showdoensis]|uniref:Endonuclease VII n=1 Tax=Streptomyces showdoensis TaxID=68268 RepID=A0A2P2GGZ0_STREW|nr:endonuclease VII domain-containing protein [Streptomyces showdoensis]KKZ70781.1 endonuclease VII [Streptomyces showdoensis]
MSEAVKHCRGCGRDVPLNGFAQDCNRGDGLQPRCRECVAAYGAERYRIRQAAKGKVVRSKADVPAGHKLCRQCGEIKPHGEWHRNTTASDGLATRCKACKKAQGRAGHLKRQYGLTEAERDEMINSQGGLCAICLAAPAAHVDHCHKTGRVRGVLCFNCNSAIGKLGDDPDVLRRAIAYLEGHAWKPTLVAQGDCRRPS